MGGIIVKEQSVPDNLWMERGAHFIKKKNDLLTNLLTIWKLNPKRIGIDAKCDYITLVFFNVPI